MRCIGLSIAIALCLASTDAECQRETGSHVVLSTRDTAAHVYTSDRSGIPDSLRVVIEDSAQLSAFWQRLTSGLASLPMPTVDFNKAVVVVAALGSPGASGPKLSIDTVVVAGNTRTVIVRRILEREGCADAGQAYEAGRATDVVVVPRTDAHVTRFIERVVRLKGCSRP